MTKPTLVNKENGQQLEITEINGRTQIVFKQAILKGKVTQEKLLNTILIAAQMHVETLVKKLSRGAPLEASEVKQLKDLAEITKLQIETPETAITNNTINLSSNSELYAQLAEKLKS